MANLHVPKFGNLEADNVSYTTYFENAIKEKGAAVKFINPNDPEDNPDAFLSAIYSPGDDQEQGRPHDGFRAHKIVGSSAEKPRKMRIPRNGVKLINENNKHEGYPRPRLPDGHEDQRADSTSKGHVNHRSSLRPMEPSRVKSVTNSALPSRNGRKPHGRHSEGSSGLSSSVRKCKSPCDKDNHNRATSVPKFGSWDEGDPRSGEGFTVIFNKVKEEKQFMGVPKLLETVVKEPRIHPERQHIRPNGTTRNKLLCCILPSTSTEATATERTRMNR